MTSEVGIQACSGGTATAQDGALMHVAVDAVEVLLVLCGSGTRANRAALAHIARVDPPSRDVPMTQVGWRHVLHSWY